MSKYFEYGMQPITDTEAAHVDFPAIFQQKIFASARVSGLHGLRLGGRGNQSRSALDDHTF
eukprot:scaffold1384_cov256-Pinguiococcus_pyrenoidosus.AAC.20